MFSYFYLLLVLYLNLVFFSIISTKGYKNPPVNRMAHYGRVFQWVKMEEICLA